MGILLRAKQVGLIAFIRPELEKLRQQGFSISQTVMDAVLQQAQE
jgi:predicted nucleic acid-binding protein